MNERETSVRLYIFVFAALLLLTAATVALGYVELGAWHLPIGLAIATMKAVLVILFFMHVIRSSSLTWVVAAAGLLWLAILLGFTLTDYATRNVIKPKVETTV